MSNRSKDSQPASSKSSSSDEEKAQADFVQRMAHQPKNEYQDEVTEPSHQRIHTDATVAQDAQDTSTLLVGESEEIPKEQQVLDEFESNQDSSSREVPLAAPRLESNQRRYAKRKSIFVKSEMPPAAPVRLKRKSTLDHNTGIDPAAHDPHNPKNLRENLEQIQKRVFQNSGVDKFIGGSKRKEEQIKEQIKRLESNPLFNNNFKKRQSISPALMSQPFVAAAAASNMASGSQFTRGPASPQAQARARSKSHFFDTSLVDQIRRLQNTDEQQEAQSVQVQGQTAKVEGNDGTGSVTKGDKRVSMAISSSVNAPTEKDRNTLGNVEDMLNEDMPHFNGDDLEGKDYLKIKRMTHRDDQKSFLVYPESRFKGYWDLFMTLVLLVSCIMTPVDIAFKQISDQSDFFVYTMVWMDVFFGIDMIVIFFSAYYDEDILLIDDRKTIAINYLKGWFTIDLFAIMPFELVLNATTEFNSIVRVVKVGKLYKLVKLTKLLRVLKIMRDKSKLLKQLNDFLKIGLGFERLFFFIIILLLLCHISCCLWVTIAALQSDDSMNFEGTWMDGYVSSNTETYLTAFYWTVTTITTVGYGDISGTNDLERGFSSLMMLVGVFAFSFANGSLASIIQNYDSTNAEYQEKIVVLNKIYKDYCLPLHLYVRLKQSLAYENQKVMNDVTKFVQDLPHKLKVEVSLYIYEERYNKLKIFRGQSAAFISWLCPLLRPMTFGDNQYIFMEGDDISGIYFLVSGEASFVLPAFNNTPYININEGDYFGLIDIIGSSQTKDFDLEDWYENKNFLQRQFAISSIRNVEVQTLSLQDLYRLQQEFVDIFNMMAYSAMRRLRVAWIMKLDAMQKCNAQQQQMLRQSESSQPLETPSSDASADDQSDQKSKKVNFIIDILDLEQIDEIGESGSGDSSDSIVSSIITDSSSSSMSSKSKDQESSVSPDVPQSAVTEDAKSPFTKQLSMSNLNSLRKSRTAKKNSFSGVEVEQKISMLRASTKNLDRKEDGAKKTSFKVIDKHDLIGNQHIKDTKEIQEEGELVLKKLQSNMKGNIAKKWGQPNQQVRRKTTNDDVRLFTSFNYNRKAQESESEHDASPTLIRKGSKRHSLLSLKKQTSTNKKVRFGMSTYDDFSQSSHTSSINSSPKKRCDESVRDSSVRDRGGSFNIVPPKLDTPGIQVQNSSIQKQLDGLQEQMNELKKSDAQRQEDTKAILAELKLIRESLADQKPQNPTSK